MIYINGKLVDFSNKKDDYEFRAVVDEYQKVIKELNEHHKGVVRFVTREPIRLDKKTGAQRRPKGYSWLTKAKVISPEQGQQIWIYTDTGAQMVGGALDPQPQSFQVTRGEVSFRIDENPEFIYFLTKHRAVKRGILTIYDPEKIERERASARRNETKFRDLIYSENSPLDQDIDKLKMIARKWGVDMVDERSVDAIRNALYETVLDQEEMYKKGQSEHGIKEFLTDFELGDTVKIGAAIQQGLDKGILTFNRETNEWLLVINKDQMPLSIMMVQPTDVDRSRQKLVEYLNRNKHDFETLDKVVRGDAVVKYGQVHDKEDVTVPNEPEVTLSNLSEATYTDMQKAAKALGLNVWGKPKKEMREILEKHLQEIQTS